MPIIYIVPLSSIHTLFLFIFVHEIILFMTHEPDRNVNNKKVNNHFLSNTTDFITPNY
ncbi:hypothetical protein XBJ1_0345 [Xenorhabdus bovienii SS-2004]|uniref:Uncharacterized protein n=1 Tax=Xenorhabdus bovienii (strain SS-2004) TaxID=406818 RepID=D3UYW7_XENBS|nr:hypothetical protein XBJ1_0345 [Xenorhabdus bovienii SS-2004]